MAVKKTTVSKTTAKKPAVKKTATVAATKKLMVFTVEQIDKLAKKPAAQPVAAAIAKVTAKKNVSVAELQSQLRDKDALMASKNVLIDKLQGEAAERNTQISSLRRERQELKTALEGSEIIAENLRKENTALGERLLAEEDARKKVETDLGIVQARLEMSGKTMDNFVSDAAVRHGELLDKLAKAKAQLACVPAWVRGIFGA